MNNWQEEFDEIVNNRMRMNNDALFRNEIPWICDFITSLLSKEREAGRKEIYDKVTALHVKAKKAYASDVWDAGYHDALFDVERAIVGAARRGDKV